MEPFAINSFLNLYRETHLNVKFDECGLFLDKDNPCIGASPDGIVTCSCHGKSCLEVKCPLSITHTTPQDPKSNLAYLSSIDGQLKLNKNHK